MGTGYPAPVTGAVRMESATRSSTARRRAESAAGATIVRLTEPAASGWLWQRLLGGTGPWRGRCGLRGASVQFGSSGCWPFIDSPLYGSAHRPPIRALHHRLYGVTDDEPPALLEITADAHLLPRILDRPWGSHAQFRRALLASDLPPFTSLVAEAAWYLLEDGELKEDSGAPTRS